MKQALTALRMFLVMTVLLGAIYPLLVTGIGKTFFAHAAGGTLLEREGKIVGSLLIAQKFGSEKYFSARPSAIAYNPLPSGGTNLGPTSKKLKESADGARQKLTAAAPQDLIFASASGLDPHISPLAAQFQIDRVARARGFGATTAKELSNLVESKILRRQFGFLGEERINVLELNLALDGMKN